LKLSAELNNFNKLELKLILLKGVVLWYNRKPDLRLLITQVLKKFFASELWVAQQEDMQISVMLLSLLLKKQHQAALLKRAMLLRP